MKENYQFRKIKDVTDIAFGDKFLRIFYPVEKHNMDQNIIRHFERILKFDFVAPFAALMPDFHIGEENVIGSVIPTKDVILVNQIGGDIGCGMLFYPLGIYLDEIRPHLPQIYNNLRKAIPTGLALNIGINDRVRQSGVWDKEFKAQIINNSFKKKLMQQMGTLGSGNHFLEIQVDEHSEIGIMIHSGSRLLGMKVKEYYISKCREGACDSLNSRIPCLHSLTEAGRNYLYDMELVMEYSKSNRFEMLMIVLEILARYVDVKTPDFTNKLIDTAHNYVRPETHFGSEYLVHRKGAISAHNGELGIIPGSMGSASFIVEGQGNPNSLMSCSHGAGRRYSRKECFKRISDREFKNSMKGIIADTDPRKKDESPAAYKNIHDVMKYQKSCIKICRKLHPLIVLKG